jgi:uncharacterized BrkB/YihY/UPF0761 family membrane protein
LAGPIRTGLIDFFRKISVKGGVRMVFLAFVGIVAFVFGLLLLFFPEAIQSINEKTNKIMSQSFVSIDDKVYRLRIGVGVSLILVSFLMLFTVYYLIKRYG